MMIKVMIRILMGRRRIRVVVAPRIRRGGRGSTAKDNITTRRRSDFVILSIYYLYHNIIFTSILFFAIEY